MYRLFIPDATARTKPLPLILYLHGGGGVGRDNQKQISGGNTAGTHTWTTPEAQRKHPAFVLAPQLADSERASGWSDAAETVLQLIAAVSRDFAIDADRVYVTGQPLGGYGTWHFITRHPDVFAAAVPLCGGGDPSRVSVGTADLGLPWRSGSRRPSDRIARDDCGLASRGQFREVHRV